MAIFWQFVVQFHYVSLFLLPTKAFWHHFQCCFSTQMQETFFELLQIMCSVKNHVKEKFANYYRNPSKFNKYVNNCNRYIQWTYKWKKGSMNMVQCFLFRFLKIKRDHMLLLKTTKYIDGSRHALSFQNVLSFACGLFAGDRYRRWQHFSFDSYVLFLLVMLSAEWSSQKVTKWT